MQIVKVEWVDSCSDNGWVKADSPRAKEHTVGHCTSVGFLFKKNKEQICIIQNTSDTGSIGELMAIPRGAIKKITVYGERSRTILTDGSIKASQKGG